MVDAEAKRQLKIKTGIVKRLDTELHACRQQYYSEFPDPC
jgi:hypothetical protein